MFSNKDKRLKKIFLLILLFAVGNTFSIYASDDHTDNTQNINKKRARSLESENDPLLTGISLDTSSSPINNDGEALEEPPSKNRKLKEGETPSNAAITDGILSAQPSTPSPLLAIELSREASSSPGAILSAPQPQRSRVSSLVATPSSASSEKPPEEETEPEDAEQIFEESRVKTNTLAYFYKDEYFDFTDWEIEISTLSSKFLESLKAKFKNHSLKTINVALAQLSLFYETDSKILKVDFMLPYFF
ncbi:hypothetical protein IM40_02750 [Candidatus Paracaedimonas acanthamoebae]|nr:hypothetical protein IM40_02750 [Candidatus Paracaedimonas acanthamoebae]